jgi:hypothetical protein
MHAFVAEAPNINLYPNPAILIGFVVFFISYMRMKGRYLSHVRFLVHP